MKWASTFTREHPRIGICVYKNVLPFSPTISRLIPLESGTVDNNVNLPPWG